MRPGLALMRYEINTGEQKTNHVLIWKKDREDEPIPSDDEHISIEDINDFLMARNAEELIRAVEKFGCQCPHVMHGEKLEKPDCALLERECRLYPYTARRGLKSGTVRAIQSYSLKEGKFEDDGDYVFENLSFWVRLHDFLCILCALIAQTNDGRPLTQAGFERMALEFEDDHNFSRKRVIRRYHGWGMRINWTAGFNTVPYYWLVPFDTDIRTVTHTIYMGDIGLVAARDEVGEFFWFCYRDSDDERLVADALIDYVTRKLLPMTCKDGAMMRDGSNGNILQKMWSVIHSCVFTSESNPGSYYIIRCKHCGRVRIANKQGGVAYFCSTSCRATWNRSHRNRNCASSDRA